MKLKPGDTAVLETACGLYTSNAPVGYGVFRTLSVGEPLLLLGFYPETDRVTANWRVLSSDGLVGYIPAHAVKRGSL